MKKAISIIFVFIVMLNAIGYQLLFSAYNLKINKELDTRIDEGRTTGIHTVIYKIPIYVNLPYLPSKPIENDLKGELDYKGNTYRYVKSTIHKDTIYYECIVNTQAKAIKKALGDYIAKNSESSNSKKAVGSTQKVLKDYLSIACLKLPLMEIAVLETKKYSLHSSMLTETHLEHNVPPPQSFS